MLFAEVERILDVLTEAEIRHWVGGGWGVDALVGLQTREHRDLDLAVDDSRLDETLDLLAKLGYAVETDWLPIRVEVAADAGWVDIHPIAIAADSSAVQAGPDDTTFDYPADAFVTGRLGDQDVACLSRIQQIAFHQGYEPRPQDEHDLRLLTQIDQSQTDHPTDILVYRRWDRMTDVLIRNVPDEELARIDEMAERLGLSRVEYLRRQITQLAGRGTGEVTVADLRQFSELTQDVLDEDVMRGAWS